MKIGYEFDEWGVHEGDTCKRIKVQKSRGRYRDTPCGNPAFWTIDVKIDGLRSETPLPICRECLSKVAANLVGLLGYADDE